MTRRSAARLTLALAVLCMVLFTYSVSTYWRLLRDGQGLVQIRNSFNFIETRNIDWPPAGAPAWFRQESRPADDFFASAARALQGPEPLTDLDLALAVVRKLHAFGLPKGERIGERAAETFKQITETGRGYCADYTKVFLALVHAAGGQAREWGMSFSAYGGQGHAFVEIYLRDDRRWAFIDAFNGFYVTGAGDDRPLSFPELRSALLLAPQLRHERLRVVRIVGVIPFRSDEAALDYLAQGAQESFIIAGNDIFSYESNPLMQALASLPASLEQAAGIALGIFPKIAIDMTTADLPAVDGLRTLRAEVTLSMLTLAGGTVLLALSAWLRRGRPSAREDGDGR